MSDFNLNEAWDDAIRQLKSDSCPNGFISLHNNGHMTNPEVLAEIYRHCVDKQSLATVVDRMTTHPEEWVRRIAAQLQDLIERRENQITDIEKLAQSSPLQPGVRLRFCGGYDYGIPWWLNGFDFYDATFVRFVERKPGLMPVALIEFDNKIDLTEHSGQIHRGKLGLMKLTYVANWDDGETVQIHVVEVEPEDINAFYDSHPFGTEIESHATFRVLAKDGKLDAE